MLKKLAAFLGVLCLVLLVMAFDEGQVERGVVVVRDKLGPAIETLRDRAKASIPTRAETPTVPESHAIVGDFLPRTNGAPGGTLDFDRAVLVFESAPALRTRPYRIAVGSEPAVVDLDLPADRQIELREVVPLDARTPVAASPLCDGEKPGWVAVARDGDDLRLLVWRAGPAPDARGAELCGRIDYGGGAR